eukprot:GEMP01003668.1.p1 GENE.GEMP01003668.1~~GEMP01003668.1.p1  ORF type:complete len:620 (+),score=99.10 GEMP01003668.1:165-2024(+)
MADLIPLDELEDTADDLPALEAPAFTKETEDQHQLRSSVNYFVLARSGEFGKLLEAYRTNPKILELRDEENHGFVHWAALFGDTEFLESVLPDGWPVDIRAGNKQTPLMWAALRGHITAMKILLQYGADIYAEDSLGASAIILAIQHREHKAFLLLCFQDKKCLNSKDASGCSLMHWAAYKGDMAALKLLAYFNSDFTLLDKAGMTPLHRAVSAAQLQACDWLITTKKLDPYVRNNDAENCFDIGNKSDNGYVRESLVLSLTKVGIRRRAEDEDVEMQSLVTGEVTLPEKEENKDEDTTCKGMVQDLFKDKNAQILFPICYFVCSCLAGFVFLTDMRHTAWEVAPTLAILVEILMPLAIGLFAWCIKSNPGKIPAKMIGRSAVEETMQALAGDTDPSEVDLNRLCTTCWIIKDLRTKHCSECNVCVAEFDHHCVWISNCVGGGNHRMFILLLILEFFAQVVHFAICWIVLKEVMASDSTFFNHIFLAVTSYPMICFYLFFHCLTLPWVAMMSVYQLRLVSQNLSTNEVMNMHRYEHFWDTHKNEHGHVLRRPRNPFDKGGALRNCLDFWVHGNRSQRGAYIPMPSNELELQTVIGARSELGHGHSHGGHQCNHNHGHHV